MVKTPKAPSGELLELRAVIAMNLRAHISAHPSLQGLAETAAAEKIGVSTGLGKNTVLRALGKGDGDDGSAWGNMRLKTLVALAAFFGIPAMHLMRDHGRSVQTIRKDQPRPEGTSSEGQGGLQRHRRV